MKRTLITSLITIHALACAAVLVSCKNPQDTQKLVTIGELGLQTLVAKKVIKPEDADLARQTGQILITPTTPPSATIAPSGK